ncbi:MAG: patatin-like phospholipase family protein [Sporolactobacillus sp.]
MWIDIVFSGGGVKGFAFVGAIDQLERAGFQFKRAAGTSAGAIVAALLAAGYTSAEMKELMETMDTSQLIDSRSPVSFALFKWLRVYFRMGLYKGDSLEKWLLDVLAAKGVHTFADLPSGALKIVVTDASRGRMVVLPDDLADYGLDPGVFSVARAARMSAGLPFFFEPMPLVADNGEKSLIVDGGLLSNFPLWLFDNGSETPDRPFLGIQTVGSMADQPSLQINNAVELFKGIFSAMREVYDEKTIKRLKDSNIIIIPTSHVATKDFSLSVGERERLFAIGQDETKLFLKKWTF